MKEGQNWLNTNSDKVMLGAALFLATEDGMYRDTNAIVIDSLPWIQELPTERSTTVSKRIQKAANHIPFIWNSIRQPILDLTHLSSSDLIDGDLPSQIDQIAKNALLTQPSEKLDMILGSGQALLDHSSVIPTLLSDNEGRRFEAISHTHIGTLISGLIYKNLPKDEHENSESQTLTEKTLSYLLYYTALNGLFTGVRTNATVYTTTFGSLDEQALDLPALVIKDTSDVGLKEIQQKQLFSGRATSSVIDTQEGLSYVILYPSQDNDLEV